MTTFTITLPFPPAVLLLAIIALINFALAWRIWIGPVFTIFMAAYIWYHVFWKTHRKVCE